MREILFRGKTDRVEWVEGCFGQHTSLDALIIHRPYPTINNDLAALDFWEVDPETVGQYTGLTDKNGTKIFEDDIVKVTNDYGETNLCSCGIGEVCFYDGVWYIGGEVNDGLYDVNKIYYIEVIGNIYDNPELLEGGAE